MRLIFFAIILFLAICVQSNAHIQAEGASNTSGWGANLPLALRLKSHLDDQNLNSCALLEKKILLALDYFYPSNFPELSSSNKTDIQTKVSKKLNSWLEQNEYIFIGLLPEYAQLNSTSNDYVTSLSTSLKFVFDTLKENQYKQNTSLINNLIIDFKKQHPKKIFILDYNKIILALSKGSIFSSEFPTESMLFKDPLHLNDKGQAFIFNNWIIPELNTILETLQCKSKINQMSYVDVNPAQISKTLLKSVLKPEKWTAKVAGTYWGKLENKLDLSTSKVKFHIPKNLINSAEDVVISTDNFDKIDEVRNKINDPIMKLKFTELYGISQLASQSDQSGFQIQQHSETELNAYTFDLSRILFFTRLAFNKKSVNDQGVYQAFGYDYWLSYKYLHRVLVWGVFLSPVPATNYQFFVKVDPTNPHKLKTKLIIYPTLQVGEKKQDVEFVRLNELSNGWQNEIINNGSSYPRLEYDINILISEP